ncbi:MAG TPA: cytochrome P450 [Acidimicrobiales bacterium]|jgi:cytochrome P450|nr:cytochrome P450 [Acidimicrobiales bacterium]
MSVSPPSILEDEPLEFDPFGPAFFGDPTEVYRRLRNESPVYFSEKYGFWALSRWDDVAAAHKDYAAFSSSYGTDLHLLSDPEKIAHKMIIFMDPPEHDRMRALVTRVFTPRAVSQLEPMVRRVIAGFADAIGDADRFDLVEQWSALFPVEIISEMLGIPEGDRQDIRLRLDVMLHRDEGSISPSAQAEAAGLESGIYFYQLVQERRKHPADDMISRLIGAEVDRGDEGMSRLGDDEIAGFLSLLAGAGAETVTKLVGNAAVLFARHPDQWRLVRDQPELIPGAVEEILRYLPPSQYNGRYLVEERTIGEVTIPAHRPVLLLTGSATRDERAFEDPDHFDITRPPSLALGFGYGVHSCLGAALARMESRIAIAEMARRWPRYGIVEDGLRRVTMSNVAGYSHVPVVVHR